MKTPSDLHENDDESSLELRPQLMSAAMAAGADPEKRSVLISRAADALKTESLGSLERSRALSGLLSILKPDAAEFRKLATLLSAARPPVRNSIAGALPRDVLPILYGKFPVEGQSGSPESPVADAISEEKRDRPAEELSADNDLPLIEESAGTVVMLSTADNQAANKNLLDQHNFAAVRITTMDALRQVVTEDRDVVAVIVDGSFLSELGDSNSQEHLFRTLASHSTFMWMKIDGSALLLSPVELQTILKDAWCESAEISINRLSLAQNSSLVEAEIDFIRAPSKALRTATRSRYLPGELTDHETSTLMAAAALHGRKWREVVAPESMSLKIEFLQGGRTQAKVALLDINGSGTPVVAKIASHSEILGEIKRFRTFIQSWDRNLQPSLHLHADCGIIIFGLVPDVDSPKSPAPTLERRFRDLWLCELYGDQNGINPPRSGDLIKAIASAKDKLLHLNSISLDDDAFDCFSNPCIHGLTRLETDNKTLGFAEEIRTARRIAEDRFKRLCDRAVVHGDVNLRNILLLGDRISYLIDYAFSGPGHPATDLVRLELALYLGPFQQAGSDGECQAFQAALSIEQCDIRTLRERFPELLSLKTNEVSVEGCVMARDAALAVVARYGGDEKDYLAAKLLFAWYGLVLSGLNRALARGIIEVVSKEVLEWAD